MKKPSIKSLSIITISLLVIASSFYFYKSKNKKNTEIDPESKIVLKKSQLLKTVLANGKVVSNLDVDIKCKASGEIKYLPFDISANVKKGNLILKLDPTDEKRNVEKAKLTSLQSQALLAKAKKDYLISTSTIKSGKDQATATLSSLKIKQGDLKSKSDRSWQLYLKSTQRNQFISNLKTAKINAKNLREKANKNLQLYNSGVVSGIDYDNAEALAKQAEEALKITQEKLKELDITKKNDYESAITASKQAEYDVKNASYKLRDQESNQATLQIKEQEIISAEAKSKSDQISLLDVQQRLKDTEVFAPISGIVTTRNVQIGQIVSSGINNVSGGTTIMTISDLSRIFINASVDESDIGSIELGQNVKITADAYPNKKFRGKVIQIAPKGITISNVVTFSVKIEVFGKDKALLKPEMTTNVEIVTLKKDNVLVVPAQAISKKEGKRIVKVLRNKETIEQEVTIGLKTADNVEVLSGLKEGDEILTDSQGKGDSKWNSKQGNNSSQVQRMMTGGAGGRR